MEMTKCLVNLKLVSQMMREPFQLSLVKVDHVNSEKQHSTETVNS